MVIRAVGEAYDAYDDVIAFFEMGKFDIVCDTPAIFNGHIFLPPFSLYSTLFTCSFCPTPFPVCSLLPFLPILGDFFEEWRRLVSPVSSRDSF